MQNQKLKLSEKEKELIKTVFNFAIANLPDLEEVLEQELCEKDFVELLDCLTKTE